MVQQGITINKLFEECKKQIQNGNGQKHILISSDDEGNGFHELFYAFSPNIKGEQISYGLPFGVDADKFNQEYIVLG